MREQNPWPTRGLASALLALCGCSPRSLGSLEHDHSPAQGQADSGAGDAGAGDAGAGDAGAVVEPQRDAAEPECRGDSQCNDGNACHAVRSCQKGTCVQVKPACVPADSDACDTCVPFDNGSCVTVAQDRDGDGHPSAACTEASQRGDDCDDHSAATHPEAQELCDGNDNDCDGVLDLQDGLEPAGKPVFIANGRYPHAAFASGHGFGVVYDQDGIQFRALDVDGKAHGDAKLVAPVARDDTQRFRPKIAWGHGAFGVTWSREHELGFRRLAEDGTPLSDAVPVAEQGETDFRFARPAPVGGDSWLVAYENVVATTPNESTALSVRAVDAMDRAGGSNVLVPDQGALFGMAAFEGRVAMLWNRIDYTNKLVTLGLSVRGADLGGGAKIDVEIARLGGTGIVGPAVMAATDDGYGVVWNQMDDGGEAKRSTHFVELDADGQPRCEPLTLNPSFSPRNNGLMWVYDMVATDRGFAIAALSVPALLSTSSAVDIIEVLAGCKYGQRFRVADSYALPWPSIARADDGSLLVLWQLESGNTFSVMARKLPPTFCE